MLDAIAPARPAEDLLSRVVRVTLGGIEYQLPVRSIKANRDWKAGLESGLTAALVSFDALDSDASTRQFADMMNSLVASIDNLTDHLLTMLLSYDTRGILPSREEIEDIEPDCTADIHAACREVWRAANPKVAIALDNAMATLAVTATETSSPPTSSPPTPITGRRTKSRSA